VIRPYREADRRALRDMTVEAFEGVSIDHNIDRLLGPVAGRDWRWQEARHVAEDLDGPAVELAAAEDGVPVGYVTMRFDPETRIGWIHNLVVASGARNRGLGPALLEHALGRFRAGGMAVARIETLE
jgi:ribosomal protein S18 acetylase RimI-like enzyme